MANIAKFERESQMYSLVEQWQNSSVSKKEICRKNNMNIYTFNYWLEKYRKKNKPSEFIEVKTLPEQTNTASSLTVKFTFAGDVSAEVPSEIAVKFMHQLIRI